MILDHFVSYHFLGSFMQMYVMSVAFVMCMAVYSPCYTVNPGSHPTLFCYKLNPSTYNNYTLVGN